MRQRGYKLPARTKRHRRALSEAVSAFWNDPLKSAELRKQRASMEYRLAVSEGLKRKYREDKKWVAKRNRAVRKALFGKNRGAMAWNNIPSYERAQFTIQHTKAVKDIAKTMRKKGLSVWTCHEGIPDILIRKNGELIAVEVTRSYPYRCTFRKYMSSEFFDRCEWVNLSGEKWSLNI